MFLSENEGFEITRDTMAQTEYEKRQDREHEANALIAGTGDAQSSMTSNMQLQGNEVSVLQRRVCLIRLVQL